MRTDDDTWDITTSVGMTAIGVAAMRALENRRPDALYRDPYAELLVRAADDRGWGRLLDAAISTDPERAADAQESTDGQGSFEASPSDETTGEQVVRTGAAIGGFMVARTCYFDDFLSTAAADGIRQVVLLAAGLDARAYRLDWPEGTTVFEIDLPKVLQFKTAALAEHGVDASADRRDVPADLRRDWPTTLAAAGFEPAVPTAWLAEGLLRYLPADAQDRLLADVTTFSAPGSRLAANFTTQAPEEDSSVQRGRMQLLRELGIHLDFRELSYPTEGRNDPAEWLAAHGWRVTHTDACRLLDALGREVPDHARATVERHRLLSADLPGSAQPATRSKTAARP